MATKWLARLVLGALAGASLVACGHRMPPPPDVTPTGSPISVPTDVPVPERACTIEHLTATIDVEAVSGNTSTFLLHFENRGPVACTLDGNPTVRLLAGSQILGVPSVDLDNAAFPRRVIDLLPAHSAASIVFFTVDKAPDVPCSSPAVTVDRVLVGLPAEPAMTLLLPRGPVALCPQPGISVTPFIEPH